MRFSQRTQNPFDSSLFRFHIALRVSNHCGVLSLQPRRKSLQLGLQLLVNRLDVIHLHLNTTHISKVTEPLPRPTYVLGRPFDTQPGRLVLYRFRDHMEVYVVHYLVCPTAVVLSRGSQRGIRERKVEGDVPGGGSSFPLLRPEPVSS